MPFDANLNFNPKLYMKTPAFFVILFALALSGRAQVGGSYQQFLHSDFADFFHVSEIRHRDSAACEIRDIKTGAFQDYISLVFVTDTASGILRSAELDVDREWISGETTADLSRDLVKSFLLDLIATKDQPKAMAAGELLYNHKPTKDAFALGLQDVFLDKKDSLTQDFSLCRVTATNALQQGKRVFVMKISGK